jgi:mannose-6-phosphate isomerase
MSDLRAKLDQLSVSMDVAKKELTDKIELAAISEGYKIVDRNDTKPWGAYLRFDGKDAEEFITEFFPGLTLEEARLGVENAELSPKILLVSPSQRLSWQKHDRRAERWTFLTEGGYHKSATDEQGELNVASAGDIVQFQKGERHRLVGSDAAYTLVAEIWQHTDVTQLSDEDDIIRIQDDYSR